MDSGYREDNGLGCLTWFAVIIGLGAIFLMMVSGDSTTTTTTRDTRSGVLSGNQAELMSRNQLNVLSEVWNCFGDNSCLITSEMITTTTSTNAPVEVVGDRNVITNEWGQDMCWDANLNTWTSSACPMEGQP